MSLVLSNWTYCTSPKIPAAKEKNEGASPCGFGRCFPSESLLHNTQAEPHWVSLAQAKIKPCSNWSIRGEKWRLCASDAGIINLTFVNSVVLLVYRQHPPKDLEVSQSLGVPRTRIPELRKLWVVRWPEIFGGFCSISSSTTNCLVLGKTPFSRPHFSWLKIVIGLYLFV